MIRTIILTAFGFLLASLPGSWDWLVAQRRYALAGGIISLVAAITLLESQTIRHGSWADALIANFFTWTMLLALLGYSRLYLSFENRLLRWARDASYPIYILHQTVIIAIAYFVIQQPWAPWVKYWVVLGSTLTTCIAIYECFIRRFTLPRILFGMKRIDASPSAVGSVGSIKDAERSRSGWRTGVGLVGRIHGIARRDKPV